MFQEKLATFAKRNFFGQILVFLLLRKPDLSISCLHFFVLGYYELIRIVLS